MSTNENGTSPDISIIKHDVKNQLSNISLAIEQLRYEIPDQTEDCQFYIDTIYASVKKINNLLDDLPH